MQAGSVLAGKYELVSQLGVGGMGEVWRAHHKILQSDVAIKLILAEAMAIDEVQQRFVREAQAVAALRSPYVVQILDYGVEEGTPFMVMEMLEGEILADRIEREQRLSPELTALAMTHIARAVGKAHEAGIIHRDLKPENVFLTYADSDVICKVLDFGIAKFQTPMGEVATATRTGALMGTPYYMSPEQAEGKRKVDARSDIWAMGVIAFECMTGRRPFDSDALGDLLMKIMVHPLPVPSQLAAVPAGFDEWFTKACSRNVEARFASAKQASDTLNQICGGVTGTTPYGLSRPSSPSLVGSPNLATNAIYPQGDGSPMGQTPQPVYQTLSGPKKSAGGVIAALAALAFLGILAVGGVGFLWSRSSQDSQPAAVASAPTAEASATPVVEPADSTPAPPVPVKPANVADAGALAKQAQNQQPEKTAATPTTTSPRKPVTRAPKLAPAPSKPTGNKAPSSAEEVL